jgi:hypothetical protein
VGLTQHRAMASIACLMAIARHAEARELACQSSCSLVLIWLAVLWGVPLGLLAGVYMPYTSGPVAY